MSFLEKIEVNPKISLEKGKIYPFVEMANVGFYTREPSLVEEKPFSSGVKFEDGDTVVARITPCLQNGKGFYCHGIGKGFGSTEYLVFRPKDDSVDNQYLYYLMQTDYVRESMIKSMIGATGRQRVNNDVFTRINVDFPEITVQRKVANALSSYDNLIENKQKQIKLLEEAAQLLYKEWFVDLHFPGYEDTEIVDGVPEGWKECKVGDIVMTSSGGTPSRSHPEYYINGENFWLKTKELSDGFIFDTEEKITDEAIKRSSAKKIEPGNIVMAMYGATIGKLGISAVDMTCNQACCVFNMKSFDNGREFLYCWLRDNRNALILKGKGSAQPNLSQELIQSINIILPSKEILEMFSKIASCYFELKGKNEKQIKFLQQARDRLLPKLMSGELEV